MTKTLSSQLGSDIQDFAIHINRETIENFATLSSYNDAESVAEYVFRVAFSDQAKSLIVAKKEQGAGELKAVMKSAVANGITKRQLAEMLKGLMSKTE